MPLARLCYKRNMANRSRRGGRRRRPQSQPQGAGGTAQNPPPLVPDYPDERWGGAGAPPERPSAPSAAEDDNRGNRAEPAPPAAPGQRSSRRRRGGRGRSGGRKRPQTTPAPAPTLAEASLASALPAAVPLTPDIQAADFPEQRASAPDFAPELQRPPQPQQAQGKPRGVVVLAIGLPGSGKSTWFKRRGVTPLSSDTLRTILFDDITEQRYQHLVFSTLRSLLRARLIARMPWNYVDATNLSPKERRHWIEMAQSFGYEAHAVFFDVPLEVCLERNARRERRVAEEIMQRMSAKLRPPTFDEGFAKITVVRVKRQPE
jgi:predicted kinase